VAATDGEALEGFRALCLSEGILPALEPAHAIGYLLARAKLGFPIFKDRETGARLAAETLRELQEKGMVGEDLKPVERVA
jgi:hypothetical protein